MPLAKGSTNKVISKNIAELNNTAPSAPREKAIQTYMKKHNYSYERAKHKLSIAIAMSNSKNG